MSAIPDIAIRRLPIYLRTLELYADNGQEIVTSQELGEHLSMSPAQIRKDLSRFGEFGKQGTGYHVAHLCQQLTSILNVDTLWPVILVGAGYLGHALASYRTFEQQGFCIVGVFDNDPAKTGLQLGQFTVRPVGEIVKAMQTHHCQIAIIAVPAVAAQEVAEQLIDFGIKGILCYAPLRLSVPKSIRVEYIDPVIHLQHITYYLEKTDASPARSMTIPRTN